MVDLLKQYHAGPAGESPDYWEEHWDAFAVDDAIARYSRDPLKAVFEANVKPGDVLLEAGCGLAQYVVLQRRLGVQAMGLDFAIETLLRVRRQEPNLPLVVGDVNALPFRDAVFDAYFSGGVVEHLESGPDAALGEAARVTRPGGVLLISVPYLSPLRRLLRPFKPTWRPIGAPGDVDAAPPGVFFQYIFSPKRFGRTLEQAGLTVHERVGYGIIRGLVDAPFGVARLLKARRTRKPSQATQSDTTGGATDTPRGIMRLLAAEDDTVRVAGRAIPVLRNLVANMAMYVCERPNRGFTSSGRP